MRKNRALSARLRRTKPKGRNGPGFTIQVPASALDINGHVNNTEYLRWAYDTLCQEQTRPNLSVLHISFHSEAFAGDVLEFGVTDGEGGLEVSGFQDRNGRPVVTAVFAPPV